MLSIIYAIGFDTWYKLDQPELQQERDKNMETIIKTLEDPNHDHTILDKRAVDYEKFYNSKSYALGPIDLPTKKSPKCEMARNISDLYETVVTGFGKEVISRKTFYNIINEFLAKGIFKEVPVTDKYREGRSDEEGITKIRKSSPLLKFDPEAAFYEVEKMMFAFVRESMKRGTYTENDGGIAANYRNDIQQTLISDTFTRRDEFPESVRKLLGWQ
jgi:hypothetical protein